MTSQNCRPAPSIRARLLDDFVEDWFLQRFGDGMIYATVYDPGNGIPERIAEIEAARERLRADREAGLYDAPYDATWFRDGYGAIGGQLAALHEEPRRVAGMVRRPDRRDGCLPLASHP
ncbi:hypothetical protein [Streptomyces sp. NPDC099088]|uniref:hypothetical protein n=1 Tax=Streptomyces sp. NPDC099088 TaxID=3366101 RepID=UPI00380010D5